MAWFMSMAMKMSITTKKKNDDEDHAEEEHESTKKGQLWSLPYRRTDVKRLCASSL